MNKGGERREGIKKLFYYFIIVNYKLIINYEDIKVISQKKSKLLKGIIRVILWIWRESKKRKNWQA